MTDELKKKNVWRQLPKWLRIFLIVIVSVLLLNVLIWAAASWYIGSHKKELLAKISEKVSDKLDGNFHIDDMKPVLLRGFPNVAVELDGITLSDSMYQTYHTNLLELHKVFLKVSVFSLLAHPRILKISLEDGIFHIFNAPNGYCNDYLLKGKPSKDSASSKKKSSKIDFDDFDLDNITINIENKPKQKQLLFNIEHINGSIHSTSVGMNIHANSKIHINHLGFDLAKGGYLTEKNLEADFHVTYDNAKKDLNMKTQPIKINGTKLNLGLDFDFGKQPQTYSIRVDAPAIFFKEASSILPRSLQKKFEGFGFNFKNQIALQASIDGHLKGPDDPLIEAKWQAKNNDFSVPFGVLTNATFNGRYYNNVFPGKGCVDSNSEITVDALTGSYYKIPVKLNNIKLFNLSKPVLDFHLLSNFPVDNLDSIYYNTFDFKNGETQVDLTYHGGVDKNDTSGHSIVGSVHITNAAFTYLPNNINFKNGNVNLVFTKSSLSLQNTTLSTDNSDIAINGFANNFMSLYTSSPDKIVFAWDVNSNKLDFNEFKGLLSSNNNSNTHNKPKASTNKSLQKMNQDLANAMQRSSADLHLHIGSIVYKTFSAQSLDATASLTPNIISLKNANVRFANGSLSADASINKDAGRKPFQLKINIKQVDVSKLFDAFANFGMGGLTSKNISGSFSTNANVNGTLNNDVDLIKNSITGNLSFNLTDGELKNFKPLMSIQKYAFKDRNLADISFKDIKNNLSISNGMITIPPMSIASNVIQINLQGIYGVDNGTDIGIDVPLSDPQKTAERIAAGKKPKKGFVVHLRAKDNGKGGTKIVLDLFHKAGKKDDGSNDQNATDQNSSDDNKSDQN